MTVELDVMVTGRMPIPHAYAFRAQSANRVARLASVLRPGGEVLRSPCLAYAIRHPSAGTVLIDTGMHPDATRDLRRDFGLRMGLLFRNLEPAAEPYDEQLRALGVEPGEVRRVIMTHLHVDHTSGMRLLGEATFACDREEWRAARRRGAGGRGYVAHHLPDESRMELLDFGAAGEPHGPFSRTIDLLGDGSVRLLSTPGHTPGHLSVLLRLAGDRQVLVVGDAAYTLRSIREELLPLLTAADGAYLRSLRELKEYWAAEPEATLVPSHDPTAWHELRDVTAGHRRPAAAPGARAPGGRTHPPR